MALNLDDLKNVNVPVEEQEQKVETSAEKVPEEVQEQVQEEVSTDEEMFQHYTSSRVSMRMITDRGIQIKFTQFGFATNVDEVIKYLDREIAAGMRDIQKGDLLSLKASNPEEALRAKFRAEWDAEQAEREAASQKALDEAKATATGTLNSSQVAN